MSQDSPVDHRFQINLTGLIDLLSNHLYTRPDVFVRELMQNGTDAIAARSKVEPGHVGNIELHVDDDVRAVTLYDNGIGLTEEEMHRFLAVIGESSKRGEWIGQPQDFIGQFGIGLLACFIVAEEIELVSRSASAPDAPTLRWRGRPDGTYDIARVEMRSEPGTTVRLVAKKESLPLFTPQALAEAAAYYGGILPWPIRVTHKDSATRINQSERPGNFPWDASHLPDRLRQQFLLDYGRRVLNADVFDAIPLLSPTGGIDGVAYILERTPVHTAKNRHRVYLKRMLLSDSVENLLPSWAFFVQCVVNCTTLRPTAARNTFYEDTKLERAQAELGACLRGYLMQLAQREPERLEKLMSYHHLALKALAVEDEDFFKLFAPWFPLETNYGRSTLQAYLTRNRSIVATSGIDEFRQIAQIAAAQRIDVINGGYVYDAALLARYGELYPQTPVRFVQPSDIGNQLQALSAEQQARHEVFLKLARVTLEPYDCTAQLKIFDPNELPVLYVQNRDAGVARQVAASAEVADDLWRDVLASIKPEASSELCFNMGNTLIRRLASHADASLAKRVVQILYVQALLMGHYPLSNRELSLMSEGLTGLLEWSVMGAAGLPGGNATWH